MKRIVFLSLLFFPVFATAQSAPLPDAPGATLTARGKLARSAKRVVAPEAFLLAGLSAGYGQALNEYEAFGQGAQGFGKRYGAYFADQSLSEFIGGGVLPAITGQDPRYYRKASGGFRRRSGYAFSRVFVTRTDRGGSTFNSSLIGGAFAAAAIGNVYYPKVDRNLPLTMRRAGVTIGATAANNLLLEFWPDLKRKLRR